MDAAQWEDFYSSEGKNRFQGTDEEMQQIRIMNPSFVKFSSLLCPSVIQKAKPLEMQSDN